MSPALRLALVAVTACSVAGCTKLRGALEEEIEERVRDDFVAGQGQPPPDNPAATEDPVEINNVQPARGLVSGGETIEIIGFGFEAGMLVAFGDEFAEEQYTEVSENSIIVRAPSQVAAGDYTVKVIDNGEMVAYLQDGYEYYDEVIVTSVAPERGPTSGGLDLVIFGTGFVDGTTVQFGSGDPLEASVVDSTVLRLTAPPLQRASWAVTVTNINGASTLTGAYTTFEPVAVDGVTPFAGPMTGGTAVTVHGAGFVPETNLRFGSQSLPAESSPTETEMTATTAAASPFIEGPVIVSADNENGSGYAVGAYVFYDETNTTPRVISVNPAASLISGGNGINLVVGGMPEGETSVYFGDTPDSADCNNIDRYSVTCIAPPAGEGSVDVRIVNGDTEVIQVDAFTYIDLRLDSLVPAEGAQAGGTYTRLLGNGFGPDTQVYFGDELARDIQVLSGGEITLRTPPGAPGSVDVAVVTRGVEIVGEDAFLYFDPLSNDGFSTGGPINGTINVTVISDEGEAMENAFVTVGAEVDSGQQYLYGFTNGDGQITLSGPDLLGTQDVHAGKPGFGAFSWVGIDAQNLVMVLSTFPEDPPDPLPECPDPEAGAPPLIRGNVYRIKDQYNTGNDYVVVTTTFDTSLSPLPDPGGNNELLNQGSYEMFSRVGELAVMAFAGSAANGVLEIHSMGIHPFVETQPSSGDACVVTDDCSGGETCIDLSGQGFCLQVYDDIDVIIDTPLSHPMRIELDDPPINVSPIQYPAAPSDTVVDVLYDFGSMGIWPQGDFPLAPYPQGVIFPPNPLQVAATEVVYVNMPKRMPELLSNAVFHVIGQVAGGNSSIGQTLSYTTEFDLQDTAGPIVLSPFVPVPYEETPGLLGQASTDPAEFELSLLPETGTSAQPNVMTQRIYTVETVPVCLGPFGPVGPDLPFIHWTVYGSPSVLDYDLPTFPAQAANANPPPGLLYWLMRAYYIPELDFNDFDPSRLGAATGVSIRSSAFGFR